jgi:predicted nucleotidyltransferase
LASTLFGLTRRDVLGLLFSRPDTAFYVREVARLTGAAVGAVQRELTALVGAGILERSERGRQVYYQADRRCPVFEELRSIVVKTSGLAEPLRAALASLAPRIEAAFVFGSLADSEGSPASDVDLFVIGDVTLGDVADVLANAEDRLGREINPVVQSPKEFPRRVTAGDHFLSRVLGEPKLFLIGDDDVLGRVGAQRVADAASHEPAGDQRTAGHRATRPSGQPGSRRQR